jgi:hypothetical protein
MGRHAQLAASMPEQTLPKFTLNFLFAQPLRGVWGGIVVVRTGHFSLKKSRPCWHG